MIAEPVAKTRYSDSELNEFRELIREKIKVAREELLDLAGSLSLSNANGDEEVIAGEALEDGSAAFEKNSLTNWPAGKKSLSSSWRPLS